MTGQPATRIPARTERTAPGVRTATMRPRRPGSSIVRRFLKGADATAAIEFALLGAVFTVLLCFLVEVGMSVLMQSLLSEGARTASRLIRTGSIQQAGGQSAPFQAAICAKVSTLMDCSQLRYNVVAGDSFAGLPTTVQTDSRDQLAGTQFQPGVAKQDVIVQVGYTRDLYFPFFSTMIGTGGRLLVLSTVVFQNEPY
ncbi:MAG: TadE/TadG family type IV pilus assembly protein [Janthinobacterium lividum]